MREFDLLVIGSGPAGQKAAIQAAKLRKLVAVIEKERVLGGSCINTGTLPSKTLKDAIYYLHGFKLRSFTNITYSLKKNMTLRDLMARKDLVIKHELEVITDQLERNDVEIIQGTASFVDQHILKVSAKSSDKDLLTAPFIVIATGSRPRRPEEIPFNDVTICDSDSILSTEVIPKSMIVMGGGVIGCEYASMFAAYGIKVTLFDKRNDLLRFVDQEIVQALIYHMRTNGVTMRLGEELDKVTTDERGLVVTTFKSGKTIITDVLLYAMGRVVAAQLPSHHAEAARRPHPRRRRHRTRPHRPGSPDLRRNSGLFRPQRLQLPHPRRVLPHGGPRRHQSIGTTVALALRLSIMTGRTLCFRKKRHSTCVSPWKPSSRTIMTAIKMARCG